MFLMQIIIYSAAIALAAGIVTIIMNQSAHENVSGRGVETISIGAEQ